MAWNDKELLQRVIDIYTVEDILEILDLSYNMDIDDLIDMEVEDVVKLYKRKILTNIEKFDVN